MKAILLSAALTLTASVGFADQAKEIGWEELAAPTSVFENPFENLTDQQMQTLARILRLDYLVETEKDAEAKVEVAGLRKDLSKEGIDADFLLAERIRIMTKLENESRMPNTSVVGQTVRMPGYLLPLELDGNLAVEFLLVPTVGACIHTPPPPANQLVLVTAKKPYMMGDLFDPVEVTGTFGTAATSTDLAEIGYTLNEAKVRAYTG